MEEYCQPPNIFTEVLKTIHNESGGSVLGGFIPNTQQMLELDQSINLVTWALVHSIYRRVSIHLMQAFKKDIESLIPNTNLDLPDAEQEIVDDYENRQHAGTLVVPPIDEGEGGEVNEGAPPPKKGRAEPGQRVLPSVAMGAEAVGRGSARVQSSRRRWSALRPQVIGVSSPS